MDINDQKTSNLSGRQFWGLLKKPKFYNQFLDRRDKHVIKTSKLEL